MSKRCIFSRQGHIYFYEDLFLYLRQVLEVYNILLIDTLACTTVDTIKKRLLGLISSPERVRAYMRAKVSTVDMVRPYRCSLL